MAIKFSNNASTKLAQTLSSTDTTMTVVSGEGAEFPAVGNNEYFLCTLVSASGEMEIVKCTARVGDVFTVVRAQEGTVAKAFSVGTVVENRLTAGSLNEVANVEQYVAEVEAAKTAAEAAQTGATQAKTDAEAAKTAAEAARDGAEAAVNSIPPQTIVKALTGSRPGGWTAADCDAPVASLSYSGNVVTVEAGLQVAYADNGRVQLSEELTSPQTIDLSAAADGTHHVYADIAEDGTFSGFGHTDVAPDVGAERNGKDIMPAFSDYTLAGWGTVSADSGVSPYVVWKAFNKTASDSNDFWGSTRSDGTGWLRITFEQPQPIIGYTVVPRAGGTNTWMPKSWNLKYGATASPEQVAQTVTNYTFPAQGLAGKSTFMLGAPIMATSLEIEITASSDPNNLVGLAMFIPLFAGDLYNSTTVTMYDKDDNPIRRVYLGWVEKVGGAITNVHCYSLGTAVTLPANGGEPVSTSSVHLQDLPYQHSLLMSAEPQLYGEGMWGKAGWIFTSAGLGVSTTIRENALRLVTGTGLTSQYASIGGDFSANVASPARIRVTVKRGF